jgi:hypothetical protein
VTFIIDGQTQAPVVLPASDKVTFTVTSFSLGSHSVEADYSGTTSGWSSSKGTLTQQVDFNSSTTVTSDANPAATLGNGANITATVRAVAPDSTTPTGTVTFIIDGSTVQTLPLSQAKDSNGNPVSGTAVATLPASTDASYLVFGANTVVAKYNGDSTHVQSSGSLAQSVVYPTSLTLTSTDQAAVYGEPVIIKAAVAPTGASSGTPTGTVTFFINGQAQTPAVTLDSTGVAKFNLPLEPVINSAYQITAHYSGDATYAASNQAATLNQQINLDSTTSTLAASANPAGNTQSVTFTDTVKPNLPGVTYPGPNDGTVTFIVDGAIVQSGPLNTAGVATFTTNALSMGQHSVVAQYSDSSNFNFGASSDSLTETVLFSSTTTLSSSNTTTVYGQSVPTFTATITTSNGASPTGTVTFYVNGTSQSVQPVSSGTATFTPSSNTALAIGADTITAVYSGDVPPAPPGAPPQTIASSSSTITQTVLSQTTTTLSSAFSTITYGQAASVQAAVAPVSPGSGVPDGTVTFTASALSGTVQLSSNVSLISGVASFDLSTLPVTLDPNTQQPVAYTITATYNGDNTTFYASSASSNSVSETVNPASTGTVLTGPTTAVGQNQTATFTATVSSSTGAVPTGTVSFNVSVNGGTPQTIVVSIDGNGQAQLMKSFSVTGSYAVTAGYNPLNADFVLSNSNTVSGPILRGTTTTLSPLTTVQPGPSNFVTFKATVKGSSTVPTGTVKFYIDGNLAGSGTVSSTTGVATFTYTQPAGSGLLGLGDHAILAVYSGNSTYAPSSASGTQGIHYLTATTLSSSANPLTVGNAVTFTATVKPTIGTPSGTVTFNINGTAFAADSYSIVSNSDGTNSLRATYTTSALTSGPNNTVASYTVKALYNPSDATFASSSATLTQKVQPVASYLKATYLPAPVGTGQAFTVYVAAYNAQNKVATTFNASGSVSVASAPVSGVVKPIGGGTLNVTFKQGRLSISGLTVNKNGQYKLHISVGGLSFDLIVTTSGRQG